MKRIFILATFFIALFATVSAISLDEIENNPSRFQLIYSSDSSDTFIDNDSIKVVRYDSPHYTITAMVYGVGYYSEAISLSHNAYFFDYDYSLNNPQRIPEKKPKRRVYQQTINYGVKFQILDDAVYNFNGSTVFPYRSSGTLTEAHGTELDPRNDHYIEAMYVFYKTYNTYFNPPVKGQLF